MNFSYCSDKYQYTMGKSFYDNGMKDKIAVFNFFYRIAPENNNWAVVSGTEEVIEMVEGIGNMSAEFFEKFLPGEEYRSFREYISKLKFTGNIWAMREGEIVFPNEPVIIVQAPIIEAQILETPLLCIMNHQMAVATKASRICRATDKPVSEFGSRRAHGPWAATYGAKAAIIAGCSSTSNILTGEHWDCGSTGTMAHSFVTSFGSTVHGEYEAFNTYIRTHRGEPLILLIDTYDSLRCGIKNAIKAFNANGIGNGYRPAYGIRLDSGDLTYLSTKCRMMLDEAGLTECKIFATNGLDEYLITELERQRAAIDFYGVGDAIATSKDAPCFGGVYKLVKINEEDVLKRSEDKIKLINPGFQLTYRITQNGKNEADVTCLRGDRMDNDLKKGNAVTLRDEYDRNKRKNLEQGSYSARPLQHQVIRNGVRCCEKHSLLQKKEYFKESLMTFDNTETRLINPHYYKVDISDDLFSKKMDIINRLDREIEQLD